MGILYNLILGPKHLSKNLGVDMGEEKSNPDNEKRKNKKINQYNVNNIIKKIIDDINEQDKVPNDGQFDTCDISNNFDVKSLADKVVNINVLRFELDRLQLDFKASAYFENDIRPLIDTLYTLGLASINFSTAASNMSNTNFGRSSEIKNALGLAEDVNEISEDLIKVLRCKVDNMLKLSKHDCK